MAVPSSAQNTNKVAQEPSGIDIYEDEGYGERDVLLEGGAQAGPGGPSAFSACFSRLKEWIKSQSWPFNTNDLACLRRLYRITMLFVIIAFALFWAWIYITETALNEDFSFSGDKFTLTVSACRILFKKGTDSDVTVHVNSKIHAEFFNSTEPEDKFFDKTDTSLKMLNPNDDVDACNIEIESASFPELEIHCDNYLCPITTDDDDLKFNGKLEITQGSEASGNVYFKRIDVESLFFNITGTASIEQLTTNQGGTILTRDGDIWVQSQQTADVTWKTFVSSAYQFVSPQAYHVNAPSCASENITMSNSTFEVNNCEGRSVVCLEAGCAGDFSLDLQSTDGGVYVQLLKEPGKLYSTNSISWRDDESLLSHGTDLLSKVKIKEIREELEGEVIYDQFVMMTMAGVNYDIGQWLFTTREAYTQFKPWWLQLCSFGLLLPIQKSLDVRLVPWPTIFSAPFDDQDMSIMGPIWNLINSEFGANPDYFLMWMDDADDVDEWFNIDQDKFGEYEREEMELTDNTPLLLAVIFSFALGLLGAIGGAIAAWIFLQKYSLKFWKGIDHRKRYKRIQLLVGQHKNTINPLLRDEIEMDDEEDAPGKGRFPPPFSLFDLLVRQYANDNRSSLNEFLKVVVKPEPEQQISIPNIRLIDIKEKYESFCFVNEYQEQIIRNQQGLLAEKMFELTSLSDSTTEAFLNIRFKNEQEQTEEADVHQIPGEDSLSFFVRAQCKITAYETDIIFLKDFNEKYVTFMHKSKAQNKIPCTKRAMVVMGVQFERLTLSVIKSTDGMQKIDLSTIDEETYKPSQTPMGGGWYFYDIIAIVMHIVLLCALMAPFFIIIVLQQNYHATMSTQDVDRFIIFQDIKYRPWLIPEKWGEFDIITWVFIGINGVILILALSELITYYSSQDWPFQPDKLIHPPSGLHKITQIVFYILVFVVASVLGLYVVVGLCWCILGAVLNPEVFLPYAAAAVTFISFCVFKVTNAIQTWKDMLREIIELVTVKMEFMLTETLDRCMTKLQQTLPGNLTNIGANLASGRYMHALAQTPIGPVLQSLNLDPEMIMAIANGDAAAISMLATQFGVDPIIVEALSAAVTQDIEALREAVPKLATIPGIGLDPEIANILVSLAWNNPNEVNMRTTVKTAVIQFTKNLLMRNVAPSLPFQLPDSGSQGMGGSSGQAGFAGVVPQGYNTGAQQPQGAYQNSAAMAQQASQSLGFDLNPRIVEALVDMANGNFDRLREILQEYEQKGFLPKNLCLIFDFLKSQTSNNHTYIVQLIELIRILCPQFSQTFLEGIGCVISDKYNGFLLQNKEATEKLYPEIDELMSVIGIPEESIFIKVMMLLTRNQSNALQRFLPELVTYLESKFAWQLEPEHLQSLFTMINGVKLNISKLSGIWAVEIDAIKCFPSLMRCPLVTDKLYDNMPENQEDGVMKTYDDEAPDEEGMDDMTIEELDMGPQSVPSGTIPTGQPVEIPLGQPVDKVPDAFGSQDPYDSYKMPNEHVRTTTPDPVKVPENSENIQSLHVSTVMEVPPELVQDPNADATNDSCIPVTDTLKQLVTPAFQSTMVAQQPVGQLNEQEEEMNPAVAILDYSIRPKARTMRWLAKRFRLSEKVVMGLFVAIRGAEVQHNEFVDALTKDFMRRTSMPKKHFEYVCALIKLIISQDRATIKECQKALEMRLRILTLVAKRFRDPRDVPKWIMINELKFTDTDSLYRARRSLTWRTDASKCEKWCKAVAIEIMSHEGIERLTLFMARGQLMMAAKIPSRFVQKLLEVNCQADETQIAELKIILQARYLRTMNGLAKMKVINELSRIFGVPQPPMLAFTEIALAMTTEQRTVGIEGLLESFEIDTDAKSHIMKSVHDAIDQLGTMQDNVKNFEAIAKLFGVPTVFCEYLSPGLIDKLQESDAILKSFIMKFASEFGVEDYELANSIAGFVMNKVKETSRFGECMGLAQTVLETSIRLFGDAHPELCIEEIGGIMKQLEASPEVINKIKSFAAIIGGYSGPIQEEKVQKPGQQEVEETQFYAPIMLETAFKIPRLIFKGLASSIVKDEQAVKEAIVELCAEAHGQFQMDEAHCRGFVSMASGTIDGVEDICQQINYEADFAEILVILSNNRMLNYNELIDHPGFNKLCVKLGLKTFQIAAMLAITQCDMDNVEEICANLDTTQSKSFDIPMITAMMSVYKYWQYDGEQPKEYDPYDQKDIIMENIKPLSSAMGIKDPQMASFIIGLAQGNAAVIEDVHHLFGWSAFERSAYGALICMFHQSPFSFTKPEIETGIFDWLAYQELGQISSMISQLFKLSEQGVQKIILAARYDSATLQWLSVKINSRGQLPEEKKFSVTEARILIKSIVSEVTEEDEEAAQFDEESEEEFDWDDLGKSPGPEDEYEDVVPTEQDLEVETARTPGDHLALVAAKKAADAETAQAQQLEWFIMILNEEYADDLKVTKENVKIQFTEENVKVLLRLAAGVSDRGNFDAFDYHLRTVHDEGENTINMQTVEELLAIPRGSSEKSMTAMAEMEKLYQLLDLQGRNQYSPENSLKQKHGIEPEQMRFLISLANREISWLDQKAGDTEIALKLVPDNKSLAKIMFALSSLEPEALAMYMPKMSAKLGIDAEMANVLVLITNSALNSASHGVIALAQRLELESSITNSFCAMAYTDIKLRFDALKAVCDRLDIQPRESVHAIFTIMAGDHFQGWEQVTQLCLDPVPIEEQGPEIDEALEEQKQNSIDLFSSLLQILQKRWDIHLRPPSDLQRGGFESMKDPPLLPKRPSMPAIGEMQFGREQLSARDKLARAMGFATSDIIDLIIGIAQNNLSTIGKIMQRYMGATVTQRQCKLIESLIQLYNKNDSMIPIATDFIENYIFESLSEDIPQGLVQAIYGCIRKLNTILIAGVCRGLEKSKIRWGIEMIPKEQFELTLKFLVHIGQGDSLSQYIKLAAGDPLKDTAELIIQKLIGTETSAANVNILLSLISADTRNLRRSIYNDWPEDQASPQTSLKNVIKDLYNLSSKDENKLSGEIAQIICSKFGLDNKEVADAMLYILGNIKDDEDQRNGGMSGKLFVLLKYFISMMPKSADVLPNQQLIQRLFIIQPGNEDQVIMYILDACFLACQDAQNNTEDILALLPKIVSSFLGDVPTVAIKLISGIILLFQSEDNKEKKTQAIKDLSEAFGCDAAVVTGFLALSKGDWMAMKDMVARVCEFETETINHIVELIIQLRKAKDADNVIVQEKVAEETDKFAQLKEKIPQGADAEAVFDMLDVSGTGTLTFEEFQEAFKIYNLRFSEERQLEMFTRYDTNGDPNELGIKDFVRIMAYIKKTISTETMTTLGLSKAKIIKGLILLVCILLVLFVFIFLGIMGFTTNSTLGSVVNSLLPISAGGILSKASSGDVQQKIKRITSSVKQVLTVLTITDV